jgi:putative inorganic carbon (HCO3(-)) transporter
MTAAMKYPVIWLFVFAAVFAILLLCGVVSLLFGSIVLLVLSVATLSAVTGYRMLLGLLVFSLPLSVNMEWEHSGAHLFVPSEGILLPVALAYILRSIFISRPSAALFRHPVTRLLLLLLLVQGITVFFSTMPLVSGKSFLIKFLYVTVFYFACAELFLSRPRDVPGFYLLYAISLSAVVIYTLVRHAGFGFANSYAATAPEPFYADHTIYSICLVFLLPLLLFFTIRAKAVLGSRYYLLLFLSLVILFLAAVFFSTSRAAWLSACVVAIVAIVFIFRIRTLHLVVLFTGILIYALFNLEYIDLAIRSNRYDSKAITADLETQAKSVTNITNDNSNAERINRWKCALRMAAQKPLTGFGPGTYQFQYFEFQKTADMTSISITSPYHVIKGQGGTAHNEFLLLLSESGVMALFFFCALVAGVIYTASRTYTSMRRKQGRGLLLAIYLGWISYTCHSLFNNFLDTDKAAFLFYSAMAAIVVADLRLRETATPVKTDP